MLQQYLPASGRPYQPLDRPPTGGSNLTLWSRV